MMTFPLILLAGMLGSSHCVGMCGGFALILGMRQESRVGRVVSQSLYTLGRVFTYAVMGALAGAFGAKLSQSVSDWINVPATLSLVAGLFLIWQGLVAAGVRLWRTPDTKTHKTPCLMATGFRSILQGPGRVNVFLAGLLTGLLPCGLVYGFLSLAASTGDLVQGSLTMIAFGVGTAPLMIATGLSGALLSVVARQRLLRVAAVCVVVTGALTVVRGAGFVRSFQSAAPATCPFCDQVDAHKP
ncbi:MAG: sulfite exporter TauE/SafE family protein [Planctomycetaceae bacterium]